jgi:hypothetical protein
MVPVVLDVRYEARYKDQIDRPAAKDLVSYVNVAALGIARDRHRHRTLLKPKRIGARQSMEPQPV